MENRKKSNFAAYAANSNLSLRKSSPENRPKEPSGKGIAKSINHHLNREETRSKTTMPTFLAKSMRSKTKLKTKKKKKRATPGSTNSFPSSLNWLIHPPSTPPATKARHRSQMSSRSDLTRKILLQVRRLRRQNSTTRTTSNLITTIKEQVIWMLKRLTRPR